jgi:hypothetical protein
VDINAHLLVHAPGLTLAEDFTLFEDPEQLQSIWASGLLIFLDHNSDLFDRVRRVESRIRI